jgi:D-alanyl-D-alanine carboxypeptidase (penicillin-binding protein 5/6)
MLFRKSLIIIITVTLILSAGLSNVSAGGIGSLSSASAVLYEPESGRILFEKNANTPRPMASTTKIMTALLAVELSSLDKVITVSAESVRVEGSALGLRGGDQITMIDLVTGLLLESGNDAANVIAYSIAGSIPAFAELMNERAKKIGMKNTVFVTPSGLDQGEHSSTAYDMALLAAEALKNETIAKICASKSALIEFGNPPKKIRVTNHNKLLQLYPYAIGMKTGFTKKSGRCLVSAAQKDGVRLVSVTLKAGDDWNDHISMYEYGFSITESVPLPVQNLPVIDVAGGSLDKVNLIMESPPSCTILKKEKELLQVELNLPKFLIAPVKSGEIIGSIRYLTGDRELCTLDIKAADDISARPVAGFWKQTIRCFINLLQAWVRL